MATRNVRGKIVLKDLGNPDAIKAEPETVRRLVHGTLIGEAAGFVQRTDPKTGEAFEGLIGHFRSIPAKSDEDELESGVLFIPDAFHNLIAASLKSAQETDPNAKVQFAFEVASVRANNPQGRSWDFKPLIDNGVQNPVDRILAGIGKVAIDDKTGKRAVIVNGATSAAIEDKSAETAAGGKAKAK